MARTTRSAGKVVKPVRATRSKTNAKAEAEVVAAVDAEEQDFQLPSDSEDDDEEVVVAEEGEDNDDEEEDDETDSELAIHEDVIGENKEGSESTNKSGHTIIKPVKESKGKKRGTSKGKRGVIYIGRLPSGFEEKELKRYFQQFGDISRLRLSRNKKSGKSKHYGFIEFKEEEVAKIASETMNNYLLMGHLLKCSLLSEDKINENLFVGANKKFKVIPFKKISLIKHDKKRSIEDWESKNKKHLASVKGKQLKLNAKGINYDISEI